jgi:nucleolar protein 4
VQQKQGALYFGRKLNVELANQRLPFKSRSGAPGRHAVAAGVRLLTCVACTCAGRKRDEAAPPEALAEGVSRARAAGGPAAKRALPSSARDAAKPPKKLRSVERTAAAAPPAPHAHLLNKSPAAARTVALGGLALPKQPGVQLDAALAVARAAGEVCDVTFPCSDEHVGALEQDGCPGKIALLVFATVDAAQGAVAALHGTALADPASRLWARQLGGEGAQVRRWRLIVRNVAFGATEAGLRQLFSSVGFVWDVHVPKLDTGRTRGFAFIAYTCRAHAESAIASLNGKTLAGRAIAVDWALSKRHYDAHQQPAGAADDDVVAPAPAAARVAQPDAESGEPLDEGALMSSVLAAVVQNGIAEAASEQPADVGITSHRGRCALASQAAARAKGSRVSDGGPVTVFAHNLSPESSARDLQLALSAFGRIKACRLVVDKVTGRSKGTAFVEFADAPAAAAAVASAGASLGVAVGGRQVQLAAAVSKEDARALGAGKAGDAAVVKDRRNFYLAREGEVLDDSPAAVGVSEADMEKRRRAAEEKVAKLQNPNFSISSTRLHIRNLPASLDEKALRGLVLSEVQARTGKRPEVKQARLLRDNTRLDGAGQERSRGMGFVDFVKHPDALAALRALNNNPTIFGKDRRPIVEFALEDARAARKHALNLKLRARLWTAADAEASEAAPRAKTERRQRTGRK